MVVMVTKWVFPWLRRTVFGVYRWVAILSISAVWEACQCWYFVAADRPMSRLDVLITMFAVVILFSSTIMIMVELVDIEKSAKKSAPPRSSATGCEARAICHQRQISRPRLRLIGERLFANLSAWQPQAISSRSLGRRYGSCGHSATAACGSRASFGR